MARLFSRVVLRRASILRRRLRSTQFVRPLINAFAQAMEGADDATNRQAMRELAASIWHFGAFMKPGMAEMLIRGHERQFIDAMVTESHTNPDAFSEDEAEKLIRWISSPTGLSGGIDYHLALFRDADDNCRLAANKFAMPMLVLNGADGFLRYSGPASVRAVASDMREELIPASGHFMAMERPRYVARAMLAFLDAPRL